MRCLAAAMIASAALLCGATGIACADPDTDFANGVTRKALISATPMRWQRGSLFKGVDDALD